MLKGRTFLVTAGPTYEPIDPVRFMGNRSSGKMGFSIAEAIADEGGLVHLITGPVHLNALNKNIIRYDIKTANEMYQLTDQIFPACNVAIMSAAVADFTPIEVSDKKIKKSGAGEEMTIRLKKTTDILKHLGEIKTDNQILIGFSLETDNEIENAKIKIRDKNLDFIVMNSLNDQGAGFEVDTNKISIIDRLNHITNYPLMPKSEVAKEIVKYLVKFLENKERS
jgi:phosphopantothenoylcysteine decarboxylase / phosphopantothenate---cysteine ligase